MNFDDVMPIFCPPYKKALDLFKEHAEGDSFYELGIGTGNVGKAILEKHPHASYKGNDLDQVMVDAAKEKLEAYNVHFHQGSIEEVVLPQVDVVVSSLALHHLEENELQDAFEKIHDAAPTFLHFEYIAGETEEESATNEQYLLDHYEAHKEVIGVTSEQVVQLWDEAKKKDKPIAFSKHREYLERVGYSLEVLLEDKCFVFYKCVRPK